MRTDREGSFTGRTVACGDARTAPRVLTKVILIKKPHRSKIPISVHKGRDPVEPIEALEPRTTPRWSSETPAEISPGR